eukprot:13231942-Alexandrium_andersonii.AAC.1
MFGGRVTDDGRQGHRSGGVAEGASAAGDQQDNVGSGMFEFRPEQVSEDGSNDGAPEVVADDGDGAPAFQM